MNQTAVDHSPELLQFLDENSIQYTRYDHPAVFTCEEAEALVPPMEAAKTKNVFLRDRKGLRHFLVVVGYHKSVDLKRLAPLIGADRLSLGSPERMLKYLGVTPGSVTILGLFWDREGPQRAVELIFDLDISEAKALRCHPMTNTATLSVAKDQLHRFLEITGHTPKIVDIPANA